MRLLVTRPEPDASAQADELRLLGHEPAVMPLLQFQSLDFDPEFLDSFDAIIITSGNALRALQEKACTGQTAQKPLFCVGIETARRARAAGFQTVSAIADSAQKLAARILSAENKIQRFVHVSGEHQAFDLEGALAREGLSIRTLNVYRMVASQAFEPFVLEFLKLGGLDGTILMSPRTAEIFVSLCRFHRVLDKAKFLRYFCLAESVAEKLKLLGASNVSIAAKPNRTDLMALIASTPPREDII